MATKELHLSVVDQNTVRVYTQLFLIFPFPDSNQKSNAMEVLNNSLQVTLTKFPFLAGTLRLADSKSGKLLLFYPVKAPDVQSSGLLTSKSLDFLEFPFAYDELKKRGMPPSAITGERFCPKDLSRYPGIPTDGEGIVDFTKSEAPVMRIQANFIPGGLILGIYTHHTAMDFSGMHRFWKEFAQSISEQKHPLIPGKGFLSKARWSSPTAADINEVPDHSNLRFQLDARIPEYTTGSVEADLYVDGKFDYVKTLPPGQETPRSQRLFVFSAKRIRTFRQQLELRSGLQIPICNVISTLVWIHVTRARASRLQQPKFKYDQTTLGISVNVRRKSEPQLDKNYTGNMALYAKVTSPIADFVSEKRVTNATIIPAVQRIKNAIDRVDNGWISRHLAFFKSITTITNTECALRFSLGPDLYLTSWMNFGADIEWNIPGTTSIMSEFIRRAYNPSDGGINIMPRRRTLLHGVEAPYEVIVRLVTEDMERLLAEEGGLADWAERVID